MKYLRYSTLEKVEATLLGIPLAMFICWMIYNMFGVLGYDLRNLGF